MNKGPLTAADKNRGSFKSL